MATTTRFVVKNGLDNNSKTLLNIGSSGSELSFSGGHPVTFTSTGTSTLTLPTSGTLAVTTDIKDSSLTLAVSGVGLAGSASFSANATTSATFTVTSNATSANTVSTVVSRDTSGNFSAGTITASLDGNATNVTGTVAIINGGTGATSATSAITNLGATTVGANLFKLTDPSATTFIRINSANTVSTRTAAEFRSDLGATTVGSALFTLSNPGSTSFIRINTDNTVTAQSASSYRSDLGANTVGSNIFTLANPSATTFIKINSDNTVTTRSASEMRTDLGATSLGSDFFTLSTSSTSYIQITSTGSINLLNASNFRTAIGAGAGTVTSVDLSMPSIFSVSNNPVTTSGTLTVSLANQTANTVFAGPTTGSATTPAFRALVSADIPSLNYAPQTTGTSLLYGNSTGGFSNATVSTGLSFSGGTLSNTGVTSVGLSLPNIFTISTSTVTTTGTLTATLSTTSANYVFAGPTTGSATTPAFRSLVAADIPSLDANKITTGTVATARLASGTASASTYLRGDQTWASVSGASPAGGSGSLQYNNAGSFGGAANARWNSTNNSLWLYATPTSTTLSAVLQMGAGFTDEVPAIGDFAGSANGTILASNIGTSFTGNQVDFQVAGSNIFKIDSSGNTTIAATTQSTSTTTGALKVSGGIGVVGNVNIGSALSITGLTTLTHTSEKLNTKTSATGTVTHDLTTGAIFYHSSISSSFTANITNVPDTNDRAIGVTLVLAQGTTAYMVTALQIDSNAQTIKWVNNSTPSGAANKVDVVGFSLIRTGSTWTVLGQYSTYG